MKNKSGNNEFHDGTTYRLWMECACGCGDVVRENFAQGHDMKYVSQLMQAVKQEELVDA